MVRDLFTKNPTHAGQLQALELLRLWMAQATTNESAYRGAEEVARLARHGVAPIDILVELCAVSMFLSDNPRVVFDQRSHDFAISGAIFKLAPRPRRVTRKVGTPWGVTLAAKGTSSYAPKPRSSAMAFVGRHLRVTLAGLIANVSTSLASREERRRTFEEALTAPFSTL